MARRLREPPLSASIYLFSSYSNYLNLIKDSCPRHVLSNQSTNLFLREALDSFHPRIKMPSIFRRPDDIPS